MLRFSLGVTKLARIRILERQDTKDGLETKREEKIKDEIYARGEVGHEDGW